MHVTQYLSRDDDRNLILTDSPPHHSPCLPINTCEPPFSKERLVLDAGDAGMLIDAPPDADALDRLLRVFPDGISYGDIRIGALIARRGAKPGEHVESASDGTLRLPEANLWAAGATREAEQRFVGRAAKYALDPQGHPQRASDTVHTRNGQSILGTGNAGQALTTLAAAIDDAIRDRNYTRARSIADTLADLANATHHLIDPRAT